MKKVYLYLGLIGGLTGLYFWDKKRKDQVSTDSNSENYAKTDVIGESGTNANFTNSDKEAIKKDELTINDLSLDEVDKPKENPIIKRLEFDEPIQDGFKQLYFNQTGREYTTDIISTPSSLSWIITRIPSWITASIMNGVGSSPITFKINDNTGATRGGVINLSNGNLTDTINVQQSGIVLVETLNTDTAKDLTPDLPNGNVSFKDKNYVVSYDVTETTIGINLTPNIGSWRLILPTGLNANLKSGFKSKNVYVTMNKNLSSENKVHLLKLVGGNGSTDTMTLIQKAKPQIYNSDPANKPKPIQDELIEDERGSDREEWA